MINTYRLAKLHSKKYKLGLSSEEGNKMWEIQLKIVKYVLDVMSSYNNSSLAKKWGKISLKLAGINTFISSCIGIYLMWR